MLTQCEHFKMKRNENMRLCLFIQDYLKIFKDTIKAYLY